MATLNHMIILAEVWQCVDLWATVSLILFGFSLRRKMQASITSRAYDELFSWIAMLPVYCKFGKYEAAAAFIADNSEQGSLRITARTLESWAKGERSPKNSRQQRHTLKTIRDWSSANARGAELTRWMAILDPPRDEIAESITGVGMGLSGDLSQGLESQRMEDEYICKKLHELKLATLKRVQSDEHRDWSSELECLRTLAGLAIERDDWSEAVAARREIVARLKQMKDPLSEAAARNDLAVAQYCSFRWHECIDNLDRCLTIWERLEDVDLRQKCRTLDYRALALRAISRHGEHGFGLDEAVESLRESLGLRLRLESPLGIASTKHRLGHVLSQVARQAQRNADTTTFLNAVEEGTMLLEEARSIRRANYQMLDFCRSTNQLAKLLTLVGKQFLESVVSLLQESRSVASKFGFRELWVHTYIIEARISRKVGDLQRAGALLGSLDGVQNPFAPSDFDKAKILEQRAKIELQLGRAQEANNFLKQAEDIWKHLSNSICAQRVFSWRRRNSDAAK